MDPCIFTTACVLICLVDRKLYGFYTVPRKMAHLLSTNGLSTLVPSTLVPSTLVPSTLVLSTRVPSTRVPSTRASERHQMRPKRTVSLSPQCKQPNIKVTNYFHSMLCSMLVYLLILLVVLPCTSSDLEMFATICPILLDLVCCIVHVHMHIWNLYKNVCVVALLKSPHRPSRHPQ